MASQGGFSQNWNAMFGPDPNMFLLVGPAGQNCRVISDTAPGMLTTGVTTDLLGVWGNSKTYLFAVGTGSTLLKFTGTWSAMSPPKAGVTLRAIFGFSTNAIYAVGDQGTIWNSDGMTWSVAPSPMTTMSYNGIWGSNENDFYIIGQGGLILHKRP